MRVDPQPKGEDESSVRGQRRSCLHSIRVEEGTSPATHKRSPDPANSNPLSAGRHFETPTAVAHRSIRTRAKQASQSSAFGNELGNETVGL
jgi:hypothetical protein